MVTEQVIMIKIKEKIGNKEIKENYLLNLSQKSAN